MFGRYLKIFLPLLTGLFILAVGFNVLAKGGHGSFEPVTLCHATNSQTNPFVEITVDNQGELNGHQHHQGDIIPAPSGGCPGGASPSPSPSPQPSPSASPSPEPCDNDPEFWGEWWDYRPSPTPCPSPSPSPEPSPSPSPTPPPQGGPGGGPEVGGNITTPQCPSDRPQKVDQVWFSDIKPGSVTVHWANKGDAQGYHIAYGPAADNLPWGVEVGNVAEVTLNDLPAGDLWVSVIAKKNADCGGPASDPVKVGGEVLGAKVLGATGIANTALLFSVSFGLIALGLWQAQIALARRGSKKA